MDPSDTRKSTPLLSLCDLAVQQHELQWHIARIEPFGDLVLPGELLGFLDLQGSSVVDDRSSAAAAYPCGSGNRCTPSHRACPVYDSRLLEARRAIARWCEAIDADDLGHHGLDEGIRKVQCAPCSAVP